VKWVGKHLNWAVLIMTVTVNLFSHYLVALFYLITRIPYWGPVYPDNTLDVLGPAFTSFYFDMELLLSSILLILGFSWVLTKKKRNRAFLWFFVAFFVIDLPYFLTYIIEFELPDIWWYLRLLSILAFFAGWLIVLLLRNKSNFCRVGEVKRNPPSK
jgi:hypothetical protein